MIIGHCFEEVNMMGGYGLVRALIYSFHMPCFVFLSGYFTKAPIDIRKSIVNYLMPYFLFNTLYSIITQHSVIVDLFTPQYIYWYLLSLFFWRLGVIVVREMKYVGAIAILIAIYIGMVGGADRFLSISRTIAFFWIGYSKGRFVENIARNINKRVALWGVCVCLVAVSFAHYTEMVPVKMYEYSQSYYASGVSTLEGIGIRCFTLSVSFILVFLLLGLVPDRPFRFTGYGQNTLITYLLSGLFVKLIFWGLKAIPFFDKLFSVSVTLVVSCLVAILVISFSNIKIITRIYTYMMNGMVSFCLR